MNVKIVTVAGILISACASNLALADHSPKKMMRNMQAYAQLGETGKLGPFDVNVSTFGSRPNGQATSKPNKKFNKFLGDKFNLAALVMKDGQIVYERYSNKRNINSNTPLLGMSMSKTAVSAAVGALLCEGRITSLDDTAGRYSPFLATTPYADVTIKNILQMNSGVSPLGRTDEKSLNHKSRGMQKFKGQADVREAIGFYKSAARQQGSTMNYHSSDTLALSALVEEISGQPLSAYFHDTVYKKFGRHNYMQWTSDKSGTTVSFSDLVMTARDWVNFGQFLMTEKKTKSCLGQFFNEGVSTAVNAGKKNGSKYGYQSWVFSVNGTPSMVLQGHGGQFIVLDEQNDTVLLTISMNEQYKAGNLFSAIHKFAERLN